jgi:amino acid adenylation domain-containing protein
MSTQAVSHLGYNFVQEAVRRQAQLWPDRSALIDEAGRQLTYEELNRSSAKLARKIHSLGVKPDDRVAVWMERSIVLIVSMLAVFEAGGAYVPIDTSYPKDRVAVMLRNSGAAVLITDMDVPSDIARPGLKIIKPASADAVDDNDDAPLETHLDPDNLAYVIYTSGSTGVPKGVAMSHRGLTRLIRWQLNDAPPALSTLQFTPICFDVTFQEVFSTLCTGGTLLLISDGLRRDPERLLVALHERAIQRLFLPYVALQQLAKASKRLGLVPQSLRHVITAGERLIVTEAISDFFSALPDCRLDNQYGPTETHLVTRLTLSRNTANWPGLPPIGTAAEGVTLYNLDDNLAPVPAGEAGELYVCGEGLARGYLGAPGLTAERFLPNPFSTEKGARMYKTGDVVRISADGVCDFVGRTDNQIKVRGFRVEPGEVELTLTDHPQVRQAAVGMRRIAADVDALVAYVVTDGASLTASELSKHVRASLPDYMVPSRFVFLDALPLTPSGKIDQLSLSEIEIPSSEIAAPAETGSLVETVRSIWERVLGHDELEEDDDFFDVGGDSLLATWVVTELSRATGREIELSVLLEDSTMAGIANTLEGMALQANTTKRTSEVVTLRAGPSQRVLFLVHPLGGELLAYRDLARSIKFPLRVIGLRWQPDEAQSALSLSMQEMAAAHLAQMRSVQPTGPYLLAGWSFGGVLAFELAQQIIASGERVDFLGLFDANPILDPTTGLSTRDTTVFDRLTKALAEIDDKLESGEEADDLSQLLADPYLGGLLGNTIAEGVTTGHIRKNLRITRDNIWATMNYRPVAYDGAVDLFQPGDADAAIQEQLTMELRPLVRGELRTHTIPGDHSTMLRAPLVEQMAQVVDKALEALSRR